jgi:Rod binding domain-containing protein
LPTVNQALEPASVRNGSPAVQKAYTSAVDFEEMLVQQLSQSLTQGTGLGGSEEGSEEGLEGAPEGGSGAASGQGGGAANSQLAALLPQALTEGVMSQGGLGMAQQLMGSLDPGAAGATANTAHLTPAGGASAAAPPSTPGAAPTSAAAAVAPSGGVQA